MNGTWLLLDCDYLCRRAYHAMHEDGPGMLYGFFRDVATWQDRFSTENIAFCFDHGPLLRRSMYPGYKAKREQEMVALSAEERASLSIFYKQRTALRDHYLRQIGFTNVFHTPGYEADDVIASLCVTTKAFGRRAIIISSDKDLYQCLGPYTSIFNPATERTYTYENFREEWDLEPHRWAYVKAIAGCATDSVPGVAGVAELTAARFLRGVLSQGTRKRAIMDSWAMARENYRIVHLPLKGCPNYPLGSKDDVTPEKWAAIAVQLGLHERLRTITPISDRAARRLAGNAIN